MKNNPKTRAAYWAITSFFSLWMVFTAYAQLALPQVQQVFTHLGFPSYFRVELSVAKIVGVSILLLPASSTGAAGLKEWAYAGFGITLASALVAHFAAGDAPAVSMWSLVAAGFLGLSYVLYLKTFALEPAASQRVALQGQVAS